MKIGYIRFSTFDRSRAEEVFQVTDDLFYTIRLESLKEPIISDIMCFIKKIPLSKVSKKLIERTK
jgi:catabolite regulation protein CreA